ncbi:hypothetical protein VCUG_02393 [Vavraia culicis subsp. floridensis]|uniref:Uncharacterized protein n=1 Tax=Vavraia culicis (isolate floridensis) TaxID=948595 RepID=L2GR59_VAVCU|nr:uncharacterized protein VCUG_02393 [Vavraia culicis subsp. floridensis]ELA46109.1 hypothetical protein VCUG_02393 [Vavraia culicis subsp. floridensis]
MSYHTPTHFHVTKLRSCCSPTHGQQLLNGFTPLSLNLVPCYKLLDLNLLLYRASRRETILKEQSHAHISTNFNNTFIYEDFVPLQAEQQSTTSIVMNKTSCRPLRALNENTSLQTAKR